MASDLDLEFMCASGLGDRLNVYSHEDQAIIATQDEADGDTARNVILNPAEALSLAIHLMDWAREHMEDLPTIGDFGDLSEESDWERFVREDIEQNADYTPEPMYCQMCGSTLVNGICPEDKPVINVASLVKPDYCQCDACRNWRMSN